MHLAGNKSGPTETRPEAKIFKKTITPDDLEKLRLSAGPKRRRFSQYPVVRKKDGAQSQYVVQPVFASINELFQQETGLATKNGPYGPYLYLSEKGEIASALAWQKERENLIFLRDTLDSSVALDYNFRALHEYTELGKAEHDAKTAHDPKALGVLGNACAATIKDVGFYKGIDAVCAVPAALGKDWDLPTEIAKRVASLTGLEDLTASIAFAASKKSIKALSLADKWVALEEGKLAVSPKVKGKRIALIDDKYQSGTTIQFVASKLFDAGAIEVHGLCCVKTWRDTDNT